MKLSAKEKQFGECLRVARVATVGSDNVPHNVPVCPIFDKNKIYFATERNAKKLRNIQSNPNVTLTFDEYSEAWDYLRGVMPRVRPVSSIRMSFAPSARRSTRSIPSMNRVRRSASVIR